MRYLRQLILLPFAPVIVLTYSGGDTTGPFSALPGLLAAFFAGTLPYTDVSYDGTAFATVMQTGIRGRADRLGRMLGAASIGIPLVVLQTPWRSRSPDAGTCSRPSSVPHRGSSWSAMASAW